MTIFPLTPARLTGLTAAWVFVAATATVTAGPVEQACLDNPDSANEPVLCACLDNLAVQYLSSEDQSRAAMLLVDHDGEVPAEAIALQDDEEFWAVFAPYAEATAACE